MNRRTGLALLVTTITGLSACVMPSPQESGPPITVTTDLLEFGGNSSRTAAGAPAPLPPLERVWTFSSRTDGISGFGPPLVAYDTVFVQSDALYALDPTGRLRWRYPGEEETGFVTEVALRRPLIFAGRTGGDPQRATVDVLDARSGSLRWSWAVPGPSAGWVSLVPATYRGPGRVPREGPDPMTRQILTMWRPFIRSVQPERHLVAVHILPDEPLEGEEPGYGRFAAPD